MCLKSTFLSGFLAICKCHSFKWSWILGIQILDPLRKFLFQTGVAGMVVCAILITIAQNVNKNSSDNGGSGNTNDTLILSDNPGENGDVMGDDVINGVGIFLIVSTLSFVVFFAIGPGNYFYLFILLGFVANWDRNKTLDRTCQVNKSLKL